MEEERSREEIIELEELRQQYEERAEMLSILANLSGLEINEIGQDELKVGFLSSGHSLTIRFKPQTVVIQEVELQPNDVPLVDVIEYAKEFNDIVFFVRETKARIQNFEERKNEIAELQNKLS